MNPGPLDPKPSEITFSLPLSPGIRNTWLWQVRVAGVNVVPMGVTRANVIVPKELNLSYFFYTLT